MNTSGFEGAPPTSFFLILIISKQKNINQIKRETTAQQLCPCAYGQKKIAPQTAVFENQEGRR